MAQGRLSPAANAAISAAASVSPAAIASIRCAIP